MPVSISADQQSGISSSAVALGPSARLPDPPTSFIGRENEIADLLTIFGRPDARLVTLNGPGGVGKTRLAIRLAQTIAADAGTTVAFVPLASVRDPSLVAATIGAAFELSDSGAQSLAERLSTILEDTPVLLVLDNFEHLVDAAPVTRLLLDACPSLSILTTSRRPLHVSGEIEFSVSPLATPAPDDSRERIEQTVLLASLCRTITSGFARRARLNKAARYRDYR
ncbi:hypothetical protein BH23CHL4_BH23CHL4_08520 [soil metagenome]